MFSSNCSLLPDTLIMVGLRRGAYDMHMFCIPGHIILLVFREYVDIKYIETQVLVLVHVPAIV